MVVTWMVIGITVTVGAVGLCVVAWSLAKGDDNEG